MVKLDVFSDPVCPWCYIGKSYFDRALEQNPAHDFAVEWHPFQLNPDMPAGGMDRRDYLEQKFGGQMGAVKVYAQIAEAALKAGLEIDFGAITRTPNTLDAHRLIHWAGLEGKQNAVVDALFKAYWKSGRDIGAQDVLCDIAQNCGLDRAIITRLLKSDADKSDIAARDAHARERGIQAVPTFIIANQYAVPGAQQPEVWAQIIADLAS